MIASHAVSRRPPSRDRRRPGSTSRRRDRCDQRPIATAIEYATVMMTAVWLTGAILPAAATAGVRSFVPTVLRVSRTARSVREPLRALLDPEQHLALHHQRAGLHRQHPDPRGERREPEAVAADQSCAAVALARARTSTPSCRPPSARRARARARPARAACGWRRSRSCRRPRVLELGQDAVGAVHVETEQVLDPVIRVGAAARRRAHLREPRPDRGGGRGDLVARVETPSASSSNSSPGSRAVPRLRLRPRRGSWGGRAGRRRQLPPPNPR